ncbi:hypothetical protein EDB81DRAFT_808107 [Dactylonectria macrodidyma]|uniref:Uncharacterized protein n=1 Tax=Dactylonectria macrodidyma TaxID=307937 RepID=A0A9P9E4B0_9HYPO|nr:hypothetical protein EDB81DRAFT_808107 [Dactylonectria macrodidyma]
MYTSTLVLTALLAFALATDLGQFVLEWWDGVSDTTTITSTTTLTKTQTMLQVHTITSTWAGTISSIETTSITNSLCTICSIYSAQLDKTMRWYCSQRTKYTCGNPMQSGIHRIRCPDVQNSQVVRNLTSDEARI